MRVAITGIAGYLGRLLFARLEQEKCCSEIVGIDLASVEIAPNRLKYVHRDIRDPRIEKDITGCDLVIHLAFIVEALHDRKLIYDINLNGSRNIFRACERAKIPGLIVASSVAAYGIQPDHIITECTPLLGDSRSYYAHTKRLVEDELDIFEARNPGCRVVRIRPGIFLGPQCNTWALEAMGTAGSFDTPQGLKFPIIHEDDVVDAFISAARRPVRGAFLVAHPEPVRGAQIAQIAGVRRRLVLPSAVAIAASELLYRLRLTRTNRDWLVLTLENSFRYDPTWTENTLEWRPKRTPEEAIHAVIENRRRIPAATRISLGRSDRIEGTRYPLMAA